MSPIERRRGTARLILVFALAAIGFWIVAGFLPALLWAVVIAIAVHPLHRRAERTRAGRRPALLAACFTLAVAVLVLAPVTLAAVQAAREARELARWVSEARAHGVPTPAWVGQLPVGAAALGRWWHENLATPEGAAEQMRRIDGAALLAQSRLLGRGLIHRGVIFAFTLIALFFLLKDRELVVRELAHAGERLFGPQGERLGRQVVQSVRGTIDGLILVGLGEGAVMAPVYLLAGLPHPILFAVVTGIAATIPFGAAAVFAIAAVLLVVAGKVAAAATVIVVGLAVVGVADHFVRPALIGGATRLPFLWVLVGIFGGVESFGLLGLFIGPAVMAVLVMLWREWLARPDPVTDGRHV